MADLQVYRAAVDAAITGQPIYLGGFTSANLPWLYPPFALVVLAPLALLPAAVAKVAISLISLAALGLIVGRSWAATAIAGSRRLGLTMGTTGILVVSEPMQQNLIMGQINVVLAAMVVVDVLTPAGGRCRGWWVGLAAGIKLTPALIVIYYAFRRDWEAVRRALFGFVSTAVLGLILLPGQSWTYWTGAIWASRIGPDHLGNQSLLGSLLRLAAVTGIGPAATHAGWLVLAVSLGLLGAGIAARQSAEPLTAYCILSATTLLISPLSWTPHWIALTPVIVVIAARRATSAGVIAVLGGVGLLLFAWPVDGVWSGLIWTVYPAQYWSALPDGVRAVGYAVIGSLYTIIGLVVLAACRSARVLPAEPGVKWRVARRPQQDSNLRHKV